MDKSKKYSQKQKDRGYPNAKVIGWKEQIKDFLSIILSVVAIVISIYTYIESRDLQVKYDRINTYNTDHIHNIQQNETSNFIHIPYSGPPACRNIMQRFQKLCRSSKRGEPTGQCVPCRAPSDRGDSC